MFAEYGQDLTWTVSLDPAEDITGWTIEVNIRAYNGGTALVTKTTSSGITVTDYGNGVFYASFTAANLALTYGPGSYVIQAHRSNSGYTYPITDPAAFVLRPADSTTYPTLTNLGAYAAHALMGITLTDAMSKQLIMLLWASEERIKKYCGRDFVYRASQTEYYDGSGTEDLRLWRTPVHTITSISEDTGGFGGSVTDSFGSDTALTSGEDYWLPLTPQFGESVSNSGIVKRINGVWPFRRNRPIGYLGITREPFPGCLKVTYTAGYRLMPFSLQWCVWQLTTLMSESAVHGRTANSESGEGYSVSFGDMGKDTLGMPIEVKAVLDQYRDGRSFVR